MQAVQCSKYLVSIADTDGMVLQCHGISNNAFYVQLQKSFMNRLDV